MMWFIKLLCFLTIIIFTVGHTEAGRCKHSHSCAREKDIYWRFTKIEMMLEQVLQRQCEMSGRFYTMMKHCMRVRKPSCGCQNTCCRPKCNCRPACDPCRTQQKPFKIIHHKSRPAKKIPPSNSTKKIVEIIIPKCINEATDVVFVIDESTTFTTVKLQSSLKAATELVDRLKIGPAANENRIGLVLFAAEARLIFDVKKYSTKDEVKQAMKNHIRKGGQKNLAAAMKTAIENAFDLKSKKQKMMVVVTDGSDVSGITEIRNLQKRAASLGIAVKVFGVKREVDSAVLAEIAGDKSNVYHVTEHKELYNALKTLICT